MTDLSLKTVGVTWNCPKLYVLSIPRTPPSSLQQNLLISFICCSVNSVMTGCFNPCRCLTLWTNSCVLAISSTQIIWSATFDVPLFCFDFAAWYLVFSSCFSFRCLSKSFVVSWLICLSTSLTERCFS